MERLFLTGTIVYGPFTDKSDIDVVMDLQDSKLFEALLISFGIVCKHPMTTRPEYKGFTIHLKNLPVIQIIVTETKEDFAAWYYATKEMKGMPAIENRDKRIFKFRELHEKYLNEQKGRIDQSLFFDDI